MEMWWRVMEESFIVDCVKCIIFFITVQWYNLIQKNANCVESLPVMKQLINMWNYIRLFWNAIKVQQGLARPITLVRFLSVSDWETRWDAADMIDGFCDQV